MTHALEQKISQTIKSTTQILAQVVHRGRVEARQRRLAQCVVIFLVVALITVLVIDYSAALIIFTYLDPSFGDINLGPEVLALSVPTTVLAFHLLISIDRAQLVENSLIRAAAIGVFAFLMGVTFLTSLSYLDAADGIGFNQTDSGLGGTIGRQTLDSAASKDDWLFQSFRNIFANIAPITFFIGMCCILFITVYVSHVLIKQIINRIEYLITTQSRQKELRREFSQAKLRARQIRLLETKIAKEKARLPDNSKHRFAQLASSAISGQLNQMAKAARGMDTAQEILPEVGQRKVIIPPHIGSEKDAAKEIGRISKATSYHAILVQISDNSPTISKG